MDNVLPALISAGASVLVGVFSLIGIIVSNNKSNAKIEKNLEIAQAVTDTKINELTREVREHNNFARRMPVVEQEIIDIKSDIKFLKQYHTEKVG
jgi:sensor domain CHASE-containing protein